MRKVFFILILVLFSNSILLFGQTNEISKLKYIGFGLHIEQFKLNDITDLSNAPVNKLIVIFNPTQFLRIEPEFGFKFGTDDKTKLESSSLNFGVGLFGQKQKDKLNIYAGIRLEYGLISSDDSNTYINGEPSSQNIYTDKLDRIMIGPALGGEYFLGDNFSIGGELNIYYVTINKSRDPKTTGYEERKKNYTSTNSGLFLRFYL